MRALQILLWIWWLGTVPRVAARTHRLVKYFNKIETDVNVSVARMQVMDELAACSLPGVGWAGLTLVA